MESIRVINRGGRQKFQRSRAQADQERAKFRVEVIEVKTHTLQKVVPRKEIFMERFHGIGTSIKGSGNSHVFRTQGFCAVPDC